MSFFKRMTALVLTLVMVFSMIPVQAFAEETEPEAEVDTGDVTIEGTNGIDELPDDPITKEHEDVAKKESAENIDVIDSTAVSNSGTCGENLTWTLSDEGVLTISGTGEMTNYTDNSLAPWYSSTSVTSAIIENGVTTIGDWAFYYCRNLTSVEIPNSVATIGDYAFYYCRNLTSVEIPDSVTTIGVSAFDRCTSLTSVEIPNSVATIGDYAFYYCRNLTSVEIPHSVTSIAHHSFDSCTSLTSIDIPDSVTTIGVSAFDSCTSLTSIDIPHSVTNIGGAAFYGCSGLTSVEIPDSVTSIGSSAFYGCSGLTSVEIPDSVISIGSSAFAYCDSLTSVEISNGVTTIGRYMFSECSSLTSVEIPDSVTSIGSSAFQNCESLTSLNIGNNVASIDSYAFRGCGSLNSVEIPNSVTSIGDSAFYGCSGLTSVTIPDSVIHIGSDAFEHCTRMSKIYVDENNPNYSSDECGVLFDKEKKELIHAPRAIVGSYSIPNSVTSIDSCAFRNCGSLTSVEIPDSVTSIGYYAFHGCSSLTSVEIPDSVTSIGEYAFYGCSSLTSMEIPGNLRSIGYYAFYGCSSLTSVEIPDSVTSIGEYAFYGCSSLTSVEIPGSVTSMGTYVFSECESLSNVTILYGVTSISRYAFRNCGGLTSVEIPDSVTSIGEYAFYGCSNLTSVEIPGSITSIDEYTFSECKKLANVTMLYGVTSIGSSAFQNCESLTSVEIPDSVTSIGNDAFYGCSSLASVEIPDSVTSIGYYAFYGCSSLASVEIPGSVTSMGTHVFCECESLANVTILYGVTSISRSAFQNCGSLTSVEIPNSVVRIDNSAFYGCSSLTSVTIPGSVTSIGEYAFYECVSLANVTLQHGVTDIGSSAFQNCGSLTSVDIPDSVTLIGSSAFRSCINLKSAIIGNCVATMGSRVFDSCTSLSSITIGNGITAIADYTFNNCTLLATVELPDTLTSIGRAAFYNCDSLQEIILPDSLRTFGDDAFKSSGLTCIDLPDGITTIPYGTFDGCGSLREILLPSSLTFIGNYALCGTSISTLIFPEGMITIDACAISFCGTLETVYIPSSVTKIGHNGFYECRAMKDVYYGGSAEQWNNIQIGPFNDGLSRAEIHCSCSMADAFPSANTTVSTYVKTHGEEQIAISPRVFGSIRDLIGTLSNVTISSSLGEVTHSGGKYLINHADAAAQDIILSKAGYRDYILPKAVTETLVTGKDAAYSLDAYMQKDTKDGKPYISTVFGKQSGICIPYTDLRVTALTVKEDTACDIIISAVGFGNQEVTYVIAQDSLRKTSNTTGVFSGEQLYDLFDDTSTVYAYAVGSDGTRTEPMVIKINREEPFDPLKEIGLDSEISLLGKDFFKIKVSDDVPVVGGTELDMSAFTFPVGVTAEGDEMKISLGIDLFSSAENEDGYKWKNFKDLVIKHTEDNTEDIEEFCKNYDLNKGKSWKTSKKANKFDMNVLGFVEGKWVKGEFIIREGQLNIGGKFMFQYTAQGALWIVPVYGSFGAGSDFSIGGKLTRFIPDKDFPFELTCLLNISPKIEGKAGVGVKGAASAGLYAEGKMPLMIAFQEEHFTLDLKGEVGVEAELFILHGKKALLEGTTNLIDWYYSTSSNTAVTLQDNSTEQVSATVISRDYAANTSGWLGNRGPAVRMNATGSGTAVAQGVSFMDLQNSIFSNSQPQLVTLGNQMLLVWVEDDTSRDTYNRMRLVYSVYKPATDSWSDPMPVWDDGHNDGYPRLVSDGEYAYVLWQKVNTTLTEENTASIDAILENTELCLAKFDANTAAFTETQMLTSNTLYEYSHNVVLINGEPVVCWAAAEDNLVNTAGSNTLYRWENGSVESLAQNLNYLLSIEAIQNKVTYVADTDGDLSDTSDVTAFTVSDSGTEAFDNSERNTAITYAGYSTLDGTHVLFLSDMRNIYYEQDGEVKSVLAETRVMDGNLNIVETDLGTTILWTETIEGWNELYAVTYNSGTWSTPVMISENGELLSNVTAVVHNGILTGICNSNTVTYDESTGDYVKGATDLVLFRVNEFSDISLGSYLNINESKLETGTETNLNLTVYNNGTTDVNQITFTITDTLGTESVQTMNVDLPSGENQIITLTYPVPEAYTTTTLTVLAEIGDDEGNTSNNTVSLEIGNHDLSVTETAVEVLPEGYMLKAVIENSSLVDAENVAISVCTDAEGTNVLQSVTIGTISREIYALADILVKEETLVFDENGVSKIYLKVSADDNDSANADNALCIVVTKQADTVCVHPVFDTVEAEDPTCTTAGHENYEICAACGETIGEIIEIPALGHDYESIVTDPTCTEQGYTTHVCKNCSESYADTYVAALGHDMGQWEPDGEGMERSECSRCDHYETREVEVIRPDAPTVKATNVASTGKIKLTWNAVDGAAKYKVYRSTDQSNWTLLKTVTGTSLTNTSVTVGTLYYYYVVAVAAGGTESDPSAVISRRCDLARPTVTLTNVASSGKIKITWKKIEGAVKYEVYRSTDNENWTLLKTTTGTSLTNTSTTAGELYYYKVKAIASNSAANSAFSAVKSRTCDLPCPEVTLSNVASTGKIKISWKAIEGAVKYQVYRSTDKENWTLLKTVTGTSLTNTSTTAGKLYYYKVRAIHEKSAANSAYSGVMSRRCDLARPTLTVKLNTSGKPYLTWTKIEGAVKYEIYRSTDNKTWTKLSTTTGTKLTHSSAVAGTTYYYKVRAIASVSNANSAYSTVKSITAG